MRLSISNIAWTAAEDAQVYALMRKYAYTGLEFAPTRFFETAPYENLDAARAWRQAFASAEGFDMPSMQSIWFGRTEKLFADEAQRQTLFAYTKKAVDFASAVQCAHLVFGSPKNRVIPDPADRVLWQQGTDFSGSLAAMRRRGRPCLAWRQTLQSIRRTISIRQKKRYSSFARWRQRASASTSISGQCLRTKSASRCLRAARR